MRQGYKLQIRRGNAHIIKIHSLCSCQLLLAWTFLLYRKDPQTAHLGVKLFLSLLLGSLGGLMTKTERNEQEKNKLNFIYTGAYKNRPPEMTKTGSFYTF